MPPWPLFFILTTAYGACVGSFLNVVMYRLPAGESLVRPPSHCPKCDHKLAWYDNVPVLGWLWLRGRCRYCRNPISLQYPVVEAVTAALFAALFAAYYLGGSAFRSEWVALPVTDTWPVFVVHLVLVAALVAASGIDARLYIIPLPIPWLTTAIAAVALPLAAWWHPAIADPAGYSGETIVPVAAGRLAGIAVGGIAGLIIAVVLLQFRLLPLSFADLDDETGAVGEPDVKPEPKPAKKSKDKGKTNSAATGAHPMARHVQVMLVMLIVVVLAGATGGIAGLAVGLVVVWWGIFLYRFDPVDGEAGEPEETPEDWLKHPHPRREIAKELLFLSFPVLGMVLGGMLLAGMFTAATDAPVAAPVRVGAGVLAGYLVGGGIIWGIRVLGTLAFGKEAMGLGDVHLLAAIGAIIGPADAVLVFFLAPFLALAHTLVVLGLGPLLKQRVAAIPYGPHLCGATLVLMIFREPIFEALDLRLYLDIVTKMLVESGIL